MQRLSWSPHRKPKRPQLPLCRGLVASRATAACIGACETSARGDDIRASTQPRSAVPCHCRTFSCPTSSPSESVCRFSNWYLENVPGWIMPSWARSIGAAVLLLPVGSRSRCSLPPLFYAYIKALAVTPAPRLQPGEGFDARATFRRDAQHLVDDQAAHRNGQSNLTAVCVAARVDRNRNDAWCRSHDIAGPCMYENLIVATF